jgi:ketosteroid isomerase-like protein
MKNVLRLLLLLTVFSVVPASAATPAEEVRATFDRFVAAQNAHDVKALEAVLLDSPQFLWITRGTPIWGRDEALRRFEAIYAGTWHLAPETGEFRVVVSQPQVAQIFVPIVFTSGAAGQPPQETRVLMNQVLVKVGSAWKVASILPIPIPPPAK